MTHNSDVRVRHAAPKDLIKATELGARLAARNRRAAGQDGDVIRREILDRFRADLADDDYTGPMQETLMAAARRGIAEVLAEAMPPPSTRAIVPTGGPGAFAGLTPGPVS